MLQQFDTNHDGKLDDNERAQMQAFMRKRAEMRAQNDQPGAGGNQQGEEHRQRLMQRFDTNHDGTLDDNERAQMRQFMQERRQEGQGSLGGPGAGPSGNQTP